MGSMNEVLTNFIQKAVDNVTDLPRYACGEGREAPKVVAHRGAWDLEGCIENTREAFLRAEKLNVWGIEFDLHFTANNEPVVNHDPDFRRLYHQPTLIRELSYLELKKIIPGLLHLKDVLCFKNFHFMIEIKTALTETQLLVLNSHLEKFEAVKDYHLLTLTPEFVRIGPQTPRPAWILVGEFNLPALIRSVVNLNLGGVAGHYLLMNRKTIAYLHSLGKKAGVGFIPSENLFNREWQRGADWVFTNHSERLTRSILAGHNSINN